MTPINEFTNDAWFWSENRLDQYPHIFWRINDEQNLPQQSLEQLRERLSWDLAKKIILFHCEGHDAQHNLDFDERIHMIQPIRFDHPRHYFFPWWYQWVMHVESSVQYHRLLESETEKKPKYMFDALLGTPYPRKRWVADRIERNSDPFLWNIGVPWVNDQAKFLHGTNLHQDPAGAKPVYNDQGEWCNHGTLLPWQIYNDSWFSIILETHSQGHAMVTEKSAKCLLGRRLFVNFGNPGVLKLIRDMGYQTFGSVIDESYDDIAGEAARFQAAWKQVEHLLSQDPCRVIEKILPVLEHNQHHFLAQNHDSDFERLVNEIAHAT